MLHRDRTLLTPQMFRCQMLLQCMTLPLRDARLVEDAASGASVHNQPQVNASVQPVICVEFDSHRVKRVCNSGVAVKPITTMYMHIVSMEGLDTIMNCSQNKPQIRMQLVQSPANGTPSPEQQRIQRVLLPFAQDAEQASTAAPPDDERDLFGREEALRMDEEIMDFQWFEHVTWDSIKDFRGATYVQPPTRFKFALQQAQHAILRAIIHNNPTSSASESAWKALVLSSWLLLGRPAVNASESNCAHFLDGRLELFGAEDWSALWAMVRSECDVSPVQNSARRTEKQQIQSRIRKVATLARTGEKGELWLLLEMRPQFQSLNKLFKKSRAFVLRIQNHLHQPQLQFQPCSCLKLLSRSLLCSEKCPGSVNQDLSACVLNTGTILALWQEIATCLCK